MTPYSPLGRLFTSAIVACLLFASLATTTHAGKTPYGWGSVPPIPLGEAPRDLVDAEGNAADTFIGVRSDGRVIAWGPNIHGVVGGVPHDLRVAAISGGPKAIDVTVGNSHAAVLLDDGTVRAWGSGPPEQLTVPGELVTPPALGAPKAVEIAAGMAHTVVRMDDGSLRAWGASSALAGLAAIAGPPALGLPTPVGLACGGYTTAVLYDDGSVQGFGANAPSVTSPPPFPGEAKAIGIAGLGSYTGTPVIILTMNDGTVRALGDPHFRGWASGIIGAVEAIPCIYGILFRRADGSIGTSGAIPGATGVSGTVSGLGSGDSSPLLLMADGSVRHVGNLDFRLADGKPINVGGKNITDLAIGTLSAMTLDSTGKLTAWDTLFMLSPPPAEAATVFTDVAIGDLSFTGSADPVVLAARADGTVAAWGADYGGLISSMPHGLGNVKSLSTGQEFAVAVRHDGTVVAWGNRAATHALDSGAATLTGVDSLATGASHALARHSDGTVSAWGNNAEGAATVPPGLTGVAAVAASTFSSFALKADGTVVAWGPATSPGGSFAVPANLAVPPASGNPRAVGIAAGREHAVVCFDDGSVQAWGYNNAGNLNTPPGTSRPVRSVHAGTHVTVALVEQAPVVRLIAVEARESVWPTGLEFRLDYPAEEDIEMDYTLTGSATFGVDYNAAATSGTFTIPMGATSALLPISVLDDYLPEPDEDIVITANPASGTSAILFEGEVVFRILDDDSALPVVSVGDVRVDEEAGASTIAVTLDRASASPVSLDFTLGGGSSLLGSDWSAPATSGTLTIPAGSLSATIPFTALGDATVEGDESFTVSLSNPVNSVLGRTPATVTLTDDDIALPQISAGDLAVLEGNRVALVPVVLNRAASDDVTLFFRTMAGSALSGRDYGGRTGSILIPSGETTATIALQILENNVAGRDLTFTLHLNALVGPAEIAGSSSTITIIDNDRLAMPPWGGTPIVWGDGSPGVGAPVVPPGAPFLTKIAAGANHLLGLRQNGTLLGWGNGSWPSGPPVPAGVTDAVDIAAGLYHSLALRADGTVAAQGSPSALGAEIVPPGLADVIAISAGRFHSLALLADGRVIAWGFNGNGQCAVPLGLPPVVAISAGEIHSMALTASGEVVCWGSNLEGESTVPGELGPCTAIAAGNLRSLAVGANGQVHYWGYNLVGSAVPAPYNGPAAPGAPRVIQANLAGDHAIVLLDNGSVVSWGNLAAHNQQVPAGLQPAFQVSGGQFFSVALVESLVRPSAVLLEDAEAAEGLSAVFGQVVLEAVAVTDVTVTLAIEPGTARAPDDFTPTPLTVTIPAGSSRGFYSIPLVDDALLEPDEYFRVRLVSVPEGWREGPSARITILDNDSIRKPVAWGAGAHLPMTEAPGTPLAIAGGGQHTLWLRDDGAVLAWGGNRQGQGNIPFAIRPGGTGTATAIAAGDNHSLAITGDGRVLAWGANLNGQCNVPSSLSALPASSGLTPISLAAGMYHSLALLQNGTVLAWGAQPGLFGSGPLVDPSSVLVPPGLSGVSAIAAGAQHSLAIDGDGVVHQWGSDGFGEMLVPTVLQSPPAPGAPHPIKLAAGFSHSLALMSDGSVITWGPGAGGPSALPAALATAPPTGSRAIAIAAGSGHSLALLENGTVLAWGDNWDGQASVPGGLAGASVLGAGSSHSMVFTTTGLQSWGNNSAGQREAPPVLPRLRSIGKPSSHALAISTSRTPVAWGYNDFGQTSLPSGLTNLRKITAGGVHSLAIGTTATATAWGDDSSGQSTLPPALGAVRAVAGGPYHSMAARLDGTLVGWGVGSSGETTPPPYVYNAIDVIAGQGFTAALLDDGQVLVWGDPWSGVTTVPNDASDVISIACGDYHVLALRRDGTVVAWGNNDNGQCNVPAGLTNVITIAAGQTHSIALTSSGSLIAWGSNEFGESTVPTGLGTICALEAGFRQNLLLVAEPAGGAGGHMLRWAEDSGLDPELFDALEEIGGLSGQLRFAFNIGAFDFAYSSYTSGGPASGLPSIRPIDLLGGAKVLRFTFIRRGDAGLDYIPQVSTDMESGSWSPVTADPTITPIDEAWEQVVIDHPVPLGTPSLFGRLAVVPSSMP